MFGWLKRDPEIVIQRPRRTRLDKRGKLVWWYLGFGAAVLIVYLVMSRWV